jgi:hypothetical protein
MQTFLEQAAAHVFKNYPDRLHRVVVVLPTNRACFFFKRALAMQADTPVFAPNVLPIDDFITQAAEAELVEPISLLWLLYDVCKEIDSNIQFDRFTSWAHPLLQDFDKIDQYLVDTKELFSYLTKIKAIERWQPDVLPNSSSVHSQLVDNYFKLWENLDRTYAALKIKLQEQKKAYRGMMYRWVAEHPEKLLEANEVDQYIFIGLNALSFAEEKILKELVKAQKATLLWDTDSYYMEYNTEAKAGDLLRRYKAQGKLGEWNWQSDYLSTDKKDFYMIGVLNASMQGKVASQIYLTLQKEKISFLPLEETAYTDSGMTAIVLPDENLLMSVLQSLDPAVEDFNITMGLSLRSSALFTLVNLLFELQYLTLSGTDTQKKTAKFNHRHVVKVLTHPFIKQYEQLFLQSQEEAANKEEATANYIRHTLSYITEFNKVFLSPEELQCLGKHEQLFTVLFTPWNGEARKALHCFYSLIDVLRQVYRVHKDAIETEYLFRFYKIIKRLDAILQEREKQSGSETLSLRSLKLFLYELFKQDKIPFSGEPVSKLQIMGMLETRTLDFENVIILSANEKVLPGVKKQNSLIPLDISLQFGLPNYRSQEATISYHFYRLLQRAKKVYFLYVLPSETYNAGEKSRFLHQIEHELVMYNPTIQIHHQTVKLSGNSSTPIALPLQVAKSAPLLEHLSREISRGISPTQINTYITCSLRYYYSYLSNLKEEEEVQESMSAGTFGNLVHKTLEEIDHDLAAFGRPIQKEDIRQILKTIPARVERIYTETHPGGSLQNGLNYLLYKVASHVIRNLLEHQLEENIFPLEILGLEKTLSTSITLEIGGKPIKVQLYGRLDRIDKTGNTIRIIDYKTGKVEKNQLKAGSTDLETVLVTNPEADKVRQLWLYKYILAKRMLHEKGLRLADRHLSAEAHELIAGIYSFRNIGEGLLTDQLRFSEEAGNNLEIFVSQSEVYLQKLISTILDPDKPFERTSRLESCTFCPYTGICGR